jgi:lipopolysaccharide/colanic/teichoic acid biosynthesis glycosyltransferase
MLVNSNAPPNGRPVRLDQSHGYVVHVIPEPCPGLYGVFKHLLDVCLAVLLLALSAPVMVLACLAVRLTSRGPMVYCQTRLGRGAKPYTIYKIRTMAHDCERNSGVCWAKPNDPRVTLVGRFLRRLHIDELPQLWNVVLGHMSLVGPRPERPEFVSELIKTIPRYRERLFVRPGLTGLAQVQLPADTDMASVRRKLAYDVFYVEHMSFSLDCRILFATVIYVLGLPFAWARVMFFVPCGEPVERAFDRPTAHQPSTVTELNPAK